MCETPSSVRVLPQHTAWVQVQVEGSSCSPDTPLAVEPIDRGGTDAVEVEPCLLSVRDEIASIPVTNHSGFIQRVEKGEELCTVMEAAIVEVTKLSRMVLREWTPRQLLILQ